MKSVEDICLETLVRLQGDVTKADFVKLATKEFKLTPKKVNMIRIRALAELGQLQQLREFVLTLNKKSEQIPYETIFDYLDSINKQTVP